MFGLRLALFRVLYPPQHIAEFAAFESDTLSAPKPEDLFEGARLEQKRVDPPASLLMTPEEARDLLLAHERRRQKRRGQEQQAQVRTLHDLVQLLKPEFPNGEHAGFADGNQAL
jgi:hypothetical protein